MLLTGKTALIINGDISLGREIALALAADGAHLAVHATKRKIPADYLAEIRPENGQRFNVYSTPVADQSSVKALFDSVRSDFGGIDVLIFNANVKTNDSAKSLSVEDLKERVNSDLTPLFRCAKEVSKVMVAQKSGKIIPVYFGIGARGDAELASWSACSGGIFGFIKCLAMEFLRYGINVNGVSYGYIEDVDFPHHVRKAVKEYVEYLSIRRAGRAGDVAEAVRFLASGRADYVTGQNLHVNGGLLL